MYAKKSLQPRTNPKEVALEKFNTGENGIQVTTMGNAEGVGADVFIRVKHSTETYKIRLGYIRAGVKVVKQAYQNVVMNSFDITDVHMSTHHYHGVCYKNGVSIFIAGIYKGTYGLLYKNVA